MSHPWIGVVLVVALVWLRCRDGWENPLKVLTVRAMAEAQGGVAPHELPPQEAAGDTPRVAAQPQSSSAR